MTQKTKTTKRAVVIAPSIAEVELHFRGLSEARMRVARLNWYALSAYLENNFCGVTN